MNGAGAAAAPATRLHLESGTGVQVHALCADGERVAGSIESGWLQNREMCTVRNSSRR